MRVAVVTGIGDPAPAAEGTRDRRERAQRPAEPRAVASVTVLLLSADASYVAEAVPVDGGTRVVDRSATWATA